MIDLEEIGNIYLLIKNRSGIHLFFTFGLETKKRKGERRRIKKVESSIGTATADMLAHRASPKNNNI